MESPSIPSTILQDEIKNLTALLAAKDAHILHLERSFAQHTEQLNAANAELLAQNEELQQTQEELLAQREFIEQQKKDLEKANKRMQANEQILAKAYENIKIKEAEIHTQKVMLEESNAELLTQNEELQQTQEELLAQREFIEQQKNDLEKANKRMQANEQILAKAYEKIKAKEVEVNTQKVMLEEYNAELLTQNEELQQTQEELLAQREFIEQQKKDLEKANKRMQANEQILSKAYEKIKQKEAEVQAQKAILEQKNVEMAQQNEELQVAQTQLLEQRNFIEEQHQILQIQTNKIKNSIEAALMIQKAILPHHQKMQQLLQNYFVIYMPKDIVSGDFWWVQKINNKTFIAAIDCTGHGVAGAFMTLITSSLLDKTVGVLGVHQPADILIKIHEEIQVVLQQKDTYNNYGMDMSLICLEENHQDTMQLTFAGAKRPIYIIENSQLTELKGTRKGIGGYQNRVTSFEQIQVEVPKGAWIYTGTDGLADQNDTARKRLGDMTVKETLLAIHHLPPAQQETQLLELLQNHMKDEEQRDDILWLGFEVATFN
jgi:serine phosphatase RsbU (regulator of sigma subunit)